MKLSQWSLAVLGILYAVIWLGCGTDGNNRIDHLIIGSSLPSLTKIAFVSSREGNTDIYVMNADGTNVVKIIEHGARIASPAWSPDGTKIVFMSWSREGTDMYVMNADGTDVVSLIEGTLIDCYPTWSPDGTKIAFSYLSSGRGDIWVMNADGTNADMITRYGVDPAWSPDGTKIACVMA